MERRGPSSSSGGDPPGRPAIDTEPSLELVRKARGGDRSALEALLRRYLPRMRRWATGRLPRWARGTVDTEDLVQDALLRTCDRIQEFEPRGEGALQAYLRQALRNRIADEVRKAVRHPEGHELPSGRPAEDASPLEEAIGREALDAYERALRSLAEGDGDLVIARVEMGMGYAEIASAFGKPSPDAARMAVSRALLRLAEGMGREGP